MILAAVAPLVIWLAVAINPTTGEFKGADVEATQQECVDAVTQARKDVADNKLDFKILDCQPVTVNQDGK